MRALILEDGASRSALAATRALGSVGWTIGIASASKGPLAATSRWARAWHPVTPPEVDADAFVETVNEAVAARGYEVVFGSGDTEILGLSSHRDRLAAAVPYARHESVVRSLDKVSLMEAARRAGFAVPRTTTPDDASSPSTPVPTVVKERSHAAASRRSHGPVAAVVATDPAEMVRLADHIRSLGGEPLLQEAVSGDLMAYMALVNREGETVADVQQEAEATWRPEAGVSVRAESVLVDEALAAKASALFSALGWFGLAQLQFVRRPDGEPVLIDMNGRFYGSLALAVAAGVNFPDLWGRLVTDRQLPTIGTAAVGIRYQWLEGDLRRAWVERRGGLVRDVMKCLRYAAGAEHSIARVEDPWPAVRYSGHLIGRAFKKALA